MANVFRWPSRAEALGLPPPVELRHLGPNAREWILHRLSRGHRLSRELVARPPAHGAVWAYLPSGLPDRLVADLDTGGIFEASPAEDVKSTAAAARQLAYQDIMAELLDLPDSSVFILEDHVVRSGDPRLNDPEGPAFDIDGDEVNYRVSRTDAEARGWPLIESVIRWSVDFSPIMFVAESSLAALRAQAE